MKCDNCNKKFHKHEIITLKEEGWYYACPYCEHEICSADENEYNEKFDDVF